MHLGQAHTTQGLSHLSLQCLVRSPIFTCLLSYVILSKKYTHESTKNYLLLCFIKGSVQVCFALRLGLGRCKGVVSDFIQAVLFLLRFRVPVVFGSAFLTVIRWHLPRLPPSYR